MHLIHLFNDIDLWHLFSMNLTRLYLSNQNLCSHQTMILGKVRQSRINFHFLDPPLVFYSLTLAPFIHFIQSNCFSHIDSFFAITYILSTIFLKTFAHQKFIPSILPTLINILAKYANYVICSNFSPFIFNLELFALFSLLNRKTDIFLTGCSSNIYNFVFLKSFISLIPICVT